MTRTYSIDRHQRAAPPLDEFPRFAHIWGEPSIESHHQNLRWMSRSHPPNLPQLLETHRERFFDKHVLAGLHRRTDQVRVAVRPGADHDTMDTLILQNGIGIRGTVTELPTITYTACAESALG